MALRHDTFHAEAAVDAALLAAVHDEERLVSIEHAEVLANKWVVKQVAVASLGRLAVWQTLCTRHTEVVVVRLIVDDFAVADLSAQLLGLVKPV